MVEKSNCQYIFRRGALISLEIFEKSLIKNFFSKVSRIQLFQKTISRCKQLKMYQLFYEDEDGEDGRD